MKSFKQFIIEAKQGAYNDEHSHVNIWNHMVGLGIAHDKNAMKKELEKSKTDKTHALHYDNADHKGFTGGKKTEGAKESYYTENETAMHTIHALATHPDFKTAISEKHRAKVMGGEKGTISKTWEKYGATGGPTSKSDISIHHSDKPDGVGLRLSLKKGNGSQLMSGGPEENLALHHHAAWEMLNTHSKYTALSDEQKNNIHAGIIKDMSNVGEHLNNMRTASRSDMIHHRNEAQIHMNAAHDRHPELNYFVRKEATTGIGKFGEDSHHAAAYLVKSASAGEAKVTHVNDHDHAGSRPRISLPKGDGRSGVVRLDEKR